MSSIKLFMGRQSHRDDRRVAARIPRGRRDKSFACECWSGVTVRFLRKFHPLESVGSALSGSEPRSPGPADRSISRCAPRPRGGSRRSEIREGLEGHLAGKRRAYAHRWSSACPSFAQDAPGHGASLCPIPRGQYVPRELRHARHAYRAARKMRERTDRRTGYNDESTANESRTWEKETENIMRLSASSVEKGVEIRKDLFHNFICIIFL